MTTITVCAGTFVFAVETGSLNGFSEVRSKIKPTYSRYTVPISKKYCYQGHTTKNTVQTDQTLAN